jgi:hypothetical protein
MLSKGQLVSFPRLAINMTNPNVSCPVQLLYLIVETRLMTNLNGLCTINFNDLAGLRMTSLKVPSLSFVRWYFFSTCIIILLYFWQN